MITDKQTNPAEENTNCNCENTEQQPIIDMDEVRKVACNRWCCEKLSITNWLKNLPATDSIPKVVEVRFKNTRKGFYQNINGLNLDEGDIIAVEASPGHDIGIVSMTGELVFEQMKKQYGKNIPITDELKRVYRKAKPVDIEKWISAMQLEKEVMLETRKVVAELGLEMKVGDVEYQGDRTKAIFYYIADERVDFRQLIKILAENFRIRIEMKQIGARQEAGRIGGIGSCGRELCCSTWISNFISVTTNSARYQDLSLNPQKLAGQCGKLKCCLNFELDCYRDALNKLPDTNIVLQSEDGEARHRKTDIFKNIMWYSIENKNSHDFSNSQNLIPLSVDTVKKIIVMNKKGKKIVKFDALKADSQVKILDYENVVGQESLTRFDEPKTNNTPSKNKGNKYKKKKKPRISNKNQENKK